MKSIFTLFILIFSFSAFGQFRFKEYPICRMDSAEKLIGHQVKLYSTLGVMEYFNSGFIFKWPSKKIKKKSGKNACGEYFPAAGDTGVVQCILEYRKSRFNNQDIAFLVQFGEYSVPVSCTDIISLDQLDSDVIYYQNRIKDSIQNIAYAADCNFKKYFIPEANIREPYTYLDTTAENFACDLSQKNIDTIILCKSYSYIGGFSSSNSISWLDKGKGYMAFIRTDYDKEISIDTISVDVQRTIDNLVNNEVYLEKTEPSFKYLRSHDSHLSARIKIGEDYYFEKAIGGQISGDNPHVKSIWWHIFLTQKRTIHESK